GSKLARSWTTSSWSRNSTVLPAERSEAGGTSVPTGKLRSARIDSITSPTAPVAPTTATLKRRVCGVFMVGPRERSKDGAWAWERGAHLGRAPSRQGSGEPARTRPGRGLPYRFAAALAAIGVGGSPARGPWPRAATRLSTASAAIARRV